MNDRLASLAAGVVEQKVASVERATMADFDKLLATDGFLNFVAGVQRIDVRRAQEHD